MNQTGETIIMSETDTQTATEDATGSGAETGQDATTDDGAQSVSFTQSELDSRVSMGIKAALAKQQDDHDAKSNKAKMDVERAQLEADGKHKELYEHTQAQYDALKAEIDNKEYKFQASEVLGKMGLSGYATVLMDGSNSIESLTTRAEAFKVAIDSGIETGVKAALETGTGRVPSNNTKAEPIALGDMNKEQITQYKKDNGFV